MVWMTITVHIECKCYDSLCENTMSCGNITCRENSTNYVAEIPGLVKIKFSTANYGSLHANYHMMPYVRTCVKVKL